MSEQLGGWAVDDRFDRFRRIAWWNQERLRDAKVLVIGAGALGNEILKNLALLGVGSVFVADLDCVEESNLSRSVLFRPADRGKPKAEVAAAAVRSIYPEIQIQSFHGNAIYDLGLGVFEWADAVIGGLDNREARLAINRACWKVNRPFIDGATEVLNGVVRVFTPPDGACYECTMSADDWTLLKERRGCFGTQASGVAAAPTPTTPITASIIAAIQCQELVKLLHNQTSLSGRGMVFNGATNDVYCFRVNKNEECGSHDNFEKIVRMGRSTTEMRARDLLQMARAELGSGCTLRFPWTLLISLRCRECESIEEVWRPVGSLTDDVALCRVCGKVRQADTCDSLSGNEAFLDRPISQLGVPLFDIVAAGRGSRLIGYQFEGDARAVLGPVLSAVAAVAAKGA